MKAVIFDFDGTLADSLLGVLAVMERRRDHDIPYTTDEIQGFRNKSFLKIARELRVPWWRLVWLAFFGRRMFAKHIDKVKAYHGILELLKKLNTAGVQCYVVSTNKAENVHAFLRAHRMERYIRAVYGKAFVLNKAPKLRTLLHQEDLAPGDVVSVGDEIVDVLSGRRAGLKVLSVAWGYTAHDALELANKGNVYDTVKNLEKALIA